MKLNCNIKVNFVSKPALFSAILVILFAISNVSFSQGRRDRTNPTINYVRLSSSDTSGISLPDSSISIDTSRLAPVDSTARLKYFKYVPQYSYGTKLPKKSSPLLLGNSSNIKTELSFDTSGNVVKTEKFEGQTIRSPLVIPLEQYLNDISQNNIQNTFTDLVNERFKGNTTDDLSKLFEKFTDITIPLPFKSESIFGPPKIELKLNGAVDITASYQNSTSEQTILNGLSNSNSSINFKQEVQLTAKGVVGDKLTIDADYNTLRLFEFENSLKLKYEGYPDEVIKKIEGGNVSLDTRSGLVGSSQALFGVKGDFQLGSLALSSVISQKKSKSEVKDFSGGAVEQAFDIKVWDYSENHYFLDTVYRESFLDYFNSASISFKTDSLSIDEQSFEIYVQTENTTVGYYKAALHVDLAPISPGITYPDSLKAPPAPPAVPVPGVENYGLVRKLSTSEYSVNTIAGFITLKINVPETYFVGVAYKVPKKNIQYGTLSTDSSFKGALADTLILKEIKVPSLIPQYTTAWELKMKNVYRLPVSKIVKEGFSFDIQHLNENVLEPTLPIANVNERLITIMGLDKHSNGREGGPDGKFDYLPGITIDPEAGYIIFPSLKPFLSSFLVHNQINPGRQIDSSFWYPQIYEQVKGTSKLLANGVKYSFVGKARGEQSLNSSINLGFNVVQGSVTVKVGEIQLTPNVDFTVDYTTGTVVIKNQSALLSKDLKVSYETNDLFTLASKTFLGMRGDYKISEKSSIGFTFVNLKQETLNDKVRLGEEPTNNSMYGIDFTTEFESKMLTNLVNLLPGFNSKVPSVISLRGELAAIDPDPNTKKSVIPQDNNEAVAYIDDMEGVKKNISMGGNYFGWTMGSIPLESSIGANDSIKYNKRGKLKWYNIPNSENIKNIYPNISVQTNNELVTPFYVKYVANKRVTYNYNGNYDSIPDKKTTWNGIMKYLNTTSSDLVNENINFIEFNMKIQNFFTNNSDAKLIIDLGIISQDAIPNRILNTEDSLGNGELRASDDKGLDYMLNDSELVVYNQKNGTNKTLSDFPNGDPAGDDNNPNGIFDENMINGTQNNLNFEGGRRPDTEDLNKTANILNPNDYFQFEIDLDTNALNRYVVGFGYNGWRQYKIPLSEYKKAYGNASFTNVQYVRMWITGVSDSILLTMYDIELTGNQWVKQIKTDTSYNITAVSIEENPQVYYPPVPGDALRQTVRGQNNVNTLSNEQSLSVEVINLNDGVRKFARKDYSTAPLDLFNYRAMKLFVNGDPTFNYTSSTVYDATMIVRFGNDSNNYYEYRAPIHPDYGRINPALRENWNPENDVVINFADLTAIKFARQSALIPYDTAAPNGPPGSVYRIYGNPDLQTIREILLGVEKNRDGLNSSISGSVWYNELRLVNVIDDNGLAYNISANAKLADLLEFNFALSETDPYFHALDGRIGTRTTGTAWDFSVTLNAGKFVNNIFSSMFSEDWGNFITLPITYRHSENMINPLYYPGTDIELEQAAQRRYETVLLQTGSTELAEIAMNNLFTETQTLGVRNNLSISNMSFNFPGGNYIVKNIINKIGFNFNADFGNARDLTYENKNDFRYTGGLSLATDFGLSNTLNLNIGNLIPMGEKYKSAKLYFFLPFIPLAPLFSQNFSASTDFNRTHSDSKQRRYDRSDVTARDFTTNRGFKFDWKFLENWIIDVNGNYDFRVGSDLTNYETDSLLSQRPEGQIFDDIFFNGGLINWGEDLNYVQAITINPKFNLPYLDRFMTINGNYNVSYAWVNPNQSTNVGFNVGYRNTISTSASFKLKEIFSLFKGSDESPPSANGVARDSVDEGPSNSQGIADILKILTSFFPGDIGVTYSQTNGVSNGSVGGLPGFGNFWFYPTTQSNLGPSRLYQLGFSLDPGSRAPLIANIPDSYTQQNELSFQTSINPIIPEAISMSLTFKTAWGFQNNLIYQSNAVGQIGSPTTKSSNIGSGNSIFFAGNMENFTFAQGDNATQTRVNLTNAFKDEISSFPFPNWNLTISGLEKFPFFSQFANSVTLENSFICDYKETKLVNINDLDIPNSQTVIQAFSPLVGLTFNFKEVMGGNLTSTFRLNSGTSNIFNPIGGNCQTVNSNEWSINANFSKTGFNLPLFGLSLQNDIQFALTVSQILNEPITYDFSTGFSAPAAGNGSTVTSINPSIQYSLSSKVSMQLFYKYISTSPTGQTVTTVPRKTNEGGLNIRIAIQ